MGSVNDTKRGKHRSKVYTTTNIRLRHMINLQSEAYLTVRATSTVPRLSRTFQQASSRAYEPWRVLQARAAFSVFSLDIDRFPQMPVTLRAFFFLFFSPLMATTQFVLMPVPVYHCHRHQRPYVTSFLFLFFTSDSDTPALLPSM